MSEEEMRRYYRKWWADYNRLWFRRIVALKIKHTWRRVRDWPFRKLAEKIFEQMNDLGKEQQWKSRLK